jgi:hypothetical protein
MDEKVRSSWSLKAAQAGIAPQAASSFGLGAIAALPVLPSAFSSASAEPRRPSAPEKEDASTLMMEGSVAPRPLEAAPVVKPMQGTPVLASDQQALAQAPVRISDLAAAQAEKDAPACRANDPASLDPAQILPTPKDDEDRPGADGQRAQDTPLPHCLIEIDPDADDGDVVAHAPSPQTVQVAAKSASAAKADLKTQEAIAATQAGKGEAPAPQAQGETATPAADQAAAKPPAAPPASETQLMVTEATRGVGTAVIDPLVPLDSIVFGGDQSLLALSEQPSVAPVTPPVAPMPLAPMPVGPDPVGDALAALGTGTAPDPFPGLGTDLLFYT